MQPPVSCFGRIYMHDSNFYPLLSHVVVIQKLPCLGLYTPTSRMEELETVKLYVILLLKLQDPSDTK